MNISNAVLDAVIKQLPSPREAQKERIPRNWNLDHLPKELRTALIECDSNHKDCVVYIPKMVLVVRDQIEAALTVKEAQRSRRTEYVRGRYQQQQEERKEMVREQVRGLIEDIIHCAVTEVDGLEPRSITEAQPGAIPESESMNGDAPNGQHRNESASDIEEKVNGDDDSEVVDVSAVWDRFVEPEVIYFDDEADEEGTAEDTDKSKIGILGQGQSSELDEISVLNGLFVGVGRVYCGTICEESNIHIFGPRHHADGEVGHSVISGFKLFHFMGSDVEWIKRVPAGNICGIGGIHDYLQKTGFVGTSKHVPMVQTVSTMSFPVVRVAIEPKRYQDLNALKLGLKLLNKCDTGTEVLIQANGEYVVCASGELHLEVWWFCSLCTL